MRGFMIGLVAATAVLMATPIQAANDGVYSTRYITDKAEQRAPKAPKAAIGARARASYAYVPRRHLRGGYSVGNDPIRRAMDDPRMYGRPNRH